MLFDFVVLGVVVVGVVLGFFLLNFYLVRLFFGDVGLILFGFLVGVLGYWGWCIGVWLIWFLVMVFVFFIVDVFVIFLRCLLCCEKFW